MKYLDKIIRFPTFVQKQEEELKTSALADSEEFFQKRYGVSVFEFLGIEGDMKETRRKINRSLQKETLQYNTQLIYEHFENQP